MSLSKGKFPILLRYVDPIKVESPVDELVRDLMGFSFDSRSNCMICALSIKDNEFIYMNRRSEMYHKSCFEKLHGCSK